MKMIRLTVIAVSFLYFMVSTTLFAQKRDFYELRTYHIENADQEEMLDAYLKDALIPAAHRNGISKVGVFKPVGSQPDAGKAVYLFLPFRSMEEFLGFEEKLAKDKAYLQAGDAYINAAYDHPPYKRIETAILRAMTGHPRLAESKLDGPKKDRIYELRSYESPTAHLYRQKVKMFNSGEMDIFEKLNCNPIFYAETVAGANMPNLMYLTTHENMQIRDEHWKAFGSDPDWKAMKDLDEYKNTVSRNDTRLLYPTEYSDL